MPTAKVTKNVSAATGGGNVLCSTLISIKTKAWLYSFRCNLGSAIPLLFGLYLLSHCKGTIFCRIIFLDHLICGLFCRTANVLMPQYQRSKGKEEKGIYYFGGSAVFRLPFLFLLKLARSEKIMVCNRFSDQELLFELIFLLFRQSFVSVAGCFIKPSR